jgi:hypothetical protein
VRTHDGSAVRFELSEDEPPRWALGGRLSIPPRLAPAEEGRFRICDLHAGEYSLRVQSAADAFKNHAVEYFTIGDNDVSGIAVTTARAFPVEGDLVWDGRPPEDAASSPVALGVTLINADYGGTGITARGTIPLHFALPANRDSYGLSVASLPAGAYVKDITYGGHSILNQLFEPGTAPAADGLRIVLARDGGRISVRAADKDGTAIADARIVIMPANATSEAMMASAMITAQSDAFGTWTSGPIAPGKYYVIATTTPVSHSIETIAKLWRARGASEVVELAPNGSAQLTRIPAPIE